MERNPLTLLLGAAIEKRHDYRWRLYYRTQIHLSFVFLAAMGVFVFVLGLSLVWAIVLAVSALFIFAMSYDRIFPPECPICGSKNFTSSQGAYKSEIFHQCTACKARFRNGRLQSAQ